MEDQVASIWRVAILAGALVFASIAGCSVQQYGAFQESVRACIEAGNQVISGQCIYR